jgi:hypothetical protein
MFAATVDGSAFAQPMSFGAPVCRRNRTRKQEHEMPRQDKKAETANADTPGQPSKRRLEQLARIWARQTGRKIVVS